MKSELLKNQTGICASGETLQKCEKFIELFREYNSHTNLMSKNDLGVIFEKHIIDSLSVVKFEEFQNCKTILDLGTGGGFPALPLAIFFEDKEITAVDSIQKKIRFIESAKAELCLDILTPVCSRIEELDKKYYKSFDLVVSRALSDLGQLITYSAPYLKKGGYLCAYKSKNAESELKNAEEVIKKYKFTHSETVSYNLKLDEKFERCLVILRKS